MYVEDVRKCHNLVEDIFDVWRNSSLDKMLSIHLFISVNVARTRYVFDNVLLIIRRKYVETRWLQEKIVRVIHHLTIFFQPIH